MRFIRPPGGNVTFDADTLHNMKSASKSVASLARDRNRSRADKKHQRTDLQLLPRVVRHASPEKDRIQLLHALTMSMGLKWVEAAPDHEDNNDETRMHMAWDPVVTSSVFRRPPRQDKSSSTTPAR